MKVCNPFGEQSAFNAVDPKLMENYVILNNLTCFPNLEIQPSNPNQTYFFKNLEHFLLAKGPEFKNKLYERFDLINEIMINECYLNNIDAVKYITLVDTDELISSPNKPVVSIENYNLTNISSLGSHPVFHEPPKESIYNILDKLFFSFRDPPSLTFLREWFLKPKVVDDLCKNLTNSINQDYLLIDLKYGEKDTHSFVVNGQDELNYALFICKLNRSKFVSDILRKFNSTMYSYLRLFSFLFDAGEKSVHRTDSVLTVTTHFSNRRYNLKKNGYIDKYPSYHERVNYENGLTAHFRATFDNRITFSIREVRCNLNYLKYF